MARSQNSKVPESLWLLAIALLILSFATPVSAKGIRCPEGMTALDVSLTINEEALRPVVMPGGNEYSFDPSGYVYLQIVTTRERGGWTPIDAGGRYRGCVNFGSQSVVSIGIFADLALEGRSSKGWRLGSINIDMRRAIVDWMDNIRQSVTSENWNAATGITTTPYPGITIDVRDASR